MNKEFKEWLERQIEMTKNNTLNEYNVNTHITQIGILEKYNELHKPVVVPKYVADWIEEEQGTMSNWKQPNRFISDSKYKKDQRRYKWSQVEGNMNKFMNALINGYEVEEEPLYNALIKGHELIDDGGMFWNFDMCDEKVIISPLNLPRDSFLTEMSKSEWSKLGINNSNADFIETEEMTE